MKLFKRHMIRFRIRKVYNYLTKLTLSQEINSLFINYVTLDDNNIDKT